MRSCSSTLTTNNSAVLEEMEEGSVFLILLETSIRLGVAPSLKPPAICTTSPSVKLSAYSKVPGARTSPWIVTVYSSLKSKTELIVTLSSLVSKISFSSPESSLAKSKEMKYCVLSGFKRLI
ncbi:hypothetical protein D3C85_940190 [compost metagenome]